MQKLIYLTMLAVGAATAAWAGYEETRELSLETAGIKMLAVDAGAGGIEISGEPGRTTISVQANIRIDERDPEKAREKIETDMVLTLQKSADRAVLKASFDGGFWNRGDSPSIDLIIRVPEQLGLDVTDGSGRIEVSNVRGDISIDDGSGELVMSGVGGNVTIEDGSGSVTISEVGGDLTINDGSGGIKVQQVAGSVTIDDGSGGIDVREVGAGLIILSDGTGGLTFADIKGSIDAET